MSKRKTVTRKSYPVRYREQKGLVQLNTSIDRAVKERLDSILNESGQTTAEFIAEQVEHIDAAKVHNE